MVAGLVSSLKCDRKMELTFQIVIILISLAMAILSGICAFYPESLRKMMPKLVSYPSAIYGDIFIRVLLGVALIFSAASSLFPAFFYILGGISVLAAFSLSIVPREKVIVIIEYMSRYIPSWAIRVVCTIGVLLFGFIIYATNI